MRRKNEDSCTPNREHRIFVHGDQTTTTTIESCLLDTISTLLALLLLKETYKKEKYVSLLFLFFFP